MAKTDLPTITSKQKLNRIAKSDSGISQLRKDYTRMRDAMQKRIRRAQEAGYLEGTPDIPTLKQIGKDPAALTYEYSRLSKLVGNQNFNVSAFREESSKRVESFQKLGYTFVTEKNENQFGKFMGYMVEKYSQDTPDGKKLLLDSDIIVEGFEYVHERTKSSNHSTISRLFNQFLEMNGYT